MKRCPTCRRDYHDDSLSFCLDDGAELLEGPGSADGSATAILYSTAPGAESPTRHQVHTTDRTAILPAEVIRKRWPILNRAVLIAVAVLVIAAGGFAAYRFLISPVRSEQINSIAVMPFENRSGNVDTEYLSDGITDSLIFRFSQLPGLRVSPTSSVMSYKGKVADVREIARDLDVDAVLTGRLLQVGDNLDISVQLINGQTKKLIWAERYDRKMADLLATQREIAVMITQKLQLKLSGDEQGIAKKYTNSNDAYQLYLRGRFHWARRRKEDVKKAIDSYEQAIAIDPAFALAYSGIAEAYNSMGKNPDAPPKDCIPRAKEAAMRALEIDPTLAQAHSALADALAIYYWDWKGSEEHFIKALELDPNISYTRLVYGASYMTAVGRADEAVKEAERAVELEPLSLINNAILVSAYVNARRYDDAVVQGRKAYDLNPDSPLTLHWLGVAYVADGKPEEAIALCRQAASMSQSSWLPTVVLGYAFAKAGNRAETERYILELRNFAKTQYVRPYYLASIYVTLGDKDKAFAELERAFDEKDCYLGRAHIDPFMDPLRDDPRFASMMKRMGLE